MSINLPDPFENEEAFSNYDSLLGASPSPLAVLLANTHVNVRVMLQNAITRVKAMGDLDNDRMDDPTLDGDSMAQLESITKVPGEGWVNSGTGVSAISVAEQSTYNGWSAIKATCNGSALAAVFTSMPSDPDLAALGAVDISDMDFISVVVDDSHLTGGAVVSTVTMTLTSSTSGFGHVADSASLTLTKTRGKEWRIAIGSITGSCDLTAVMGVKFQVNDNGTTHPANGDFLYAFSIRAYKTAYDPTVTLDPNTRRGAVGMPVTWDLAAPTAGLATLIRGVGNTSDPTSQDEVSRMFVALGDLNIASTGTRNTVDFIFREDKVAGTYVRVRFFWYSGDLRVQADYFNGSFQNLIPSTVAISGASWTTLKAGGQMVLEGRITGTKIGMKVYASNVNEQIGSVVYDNNLPDFGAALPVTVGRIGWGAVLVDRDTYLNAFDSFVTSVASGVTKTRLYLSPIEAVAIATASAVDTNNFTDFSSFGGVELDQDFTKIVDPATFSWSSKGPIISNSVFVRDSSEAYIDFDIWVPAEATTFPRVVLRSRDLAGNSAITTPPLVLQTNQWNHVHIELDNASVAILGITCYVYLEADNSGSLPYTFNVANMGIFTRNVRWSAKVNDVAPFRPFRDMTNAVDGKLHFPRDERGRELQVSFEALTESAWASSFTTTVQYAPLGLPLYYRL